MKRRVLLLIVVVLMEALVLVAMAAPAFAAAKFGAPPGAAPGNFRRSGTANEHDLTLHPAGHNAGQCQAASCTTTTP